ncbi:uncharacterized protein Dvir_GJ16730 [Drosophila virilis]|uniref:Calponin-homology (CH) domain-containing protein n=1 Tax=Drosophila virilis TaxID=7244 RepID=A0A0Q9WE62_DROVI|nr:uncharacterized protein Dvir_GJ16730 [Drosophila virilis]
MQRAQQLSELRRKSLGNVSSYKSSAPADTPDIVKSSLPKDQAPLLKKFGPPQRHHYVPNAYQSPQLNKQLSSSSQHISSSSSSSQHISNISSSSCTTSFASQQKPLIVETPATPQPGVNASAAEPLPEDQIPRNIVFNNVSAFSSLSRRSLDEEHHQQQLVNGGSRLNRLSKCDSWHQICQQQQQQQTTPLQSQLPPQPQQQQLPRFGELRRTKSGHSLAVPKLYEAGIDKEQLGEKQRTVAAYFSGQKSPTGAQLEELRTTTTTTTTATSATTANRKSAINRTKTSEKLSAARKSLSSLNSSSNAQHKQQSSTTSERTETKSKDGGAVVTTTTTKVTTRTVSGSAATKNISPLAKFKQLDKAAAQQQAQKSSPTTSTPTTPGGSAQPLFKFTDPALNGGAPNVKDQISRWGRPKTRELGNVQISNFSSSWSDGLAFCALIHHFLPDAFDYSKLTKQTRKHNFELAFSVADEKAGIAPLLDVEDMVEMSRPDWKCVFVYVQSIYRRFRNCQ